MKNGKDSERAKKFRLIRIVTVELIIMAVSVCVCIMPQPYNIIVPIIIGARSILLKAKLYSKNPPAPDVSHYCELTETKTRKEKKTNAKVKEKGGGKTVQKTTRKGNKKAA